MSKTIKDFLLQADPSIGNRNTGSGSTVTKEPIEPSRIRKWKEFDLQTLLTMGDGVFKRALHQRIEADGYKKFRSVRESAPANERALENILIRTVCQDVSLALKWTQEYLKTQNDIPRVRDINIRMAGGSEAQEVFGKERTVYYPDWAGISLELGMSLDDRQRGSGSKWADDLPKTCLPGDTKLHSKVKLTELENNCMEWNKFAEVSDPGIQLALLQITTYCYWSDCRYGYIITESGLLVVRIQPSECDENDLKAALKYQTLLEWRLIAYGTSQPSEMSVSLALWWLHLLAAIDHTLDWTYPALKDMDLRSPSGTNTGSPQHASFKRCRSLSPSPAPQSQIDDGVPDEPRPCRPRKMRRAIQQRASTPKHTISPAREDSLIEISPDEFKQSAKQNEAIPENDFTGVTSAKPAVSTEQDELKKPTEPESQSAITLSQMGINQALWNDQSCPDFLALWNFECDVLANWDSQLLSNPLPA